MRDFKVRLIRETRNVASCAVRSHKQYYIHVKFDLNFSLSDVISHRDNIAFQHKFHHICTNS